MPTDSGDKGQGYLPALRFRALTGLFDAVVRVMREHEFKARLVQQAAPGDGQSVLDIGCGTGTLALLVKERAPRTDVIGLDADEEILERAKVKAADSGLEVRFDRGLSTELPYGDDTFDLVVSTLFFHHLDGDSKRKTAREIARVLRPGGELHVADFGRPADPLMALAIGPVRLFDGFEQTRDNVRGRLPLIFMQGGLVEAQETDRLRTVLGLISLYRAGKPRSDRPAPHPRGAEIPGGPPAA